MCCWNGSWEFGDDRGWGNEEGWAVYLQENLQLMEKALGGSFQAPMAVTSLGPCWLLAPSLGPEQDGSHSL